MTRSILLVLCALVLAGCGDALAFGVRPNHLGGGSGLLAIVLAVAAVGVAVILRRIIKRNKP